MLEWAQLRDEHKCILLLGAEDSDLRSLLVTWVPDIDQGDHGSAVDLLSAALLDLVDAELVEAYVYTDTFPEVKTLDRDEVVRAIANRRAWWNNYEPLEAVVWFITTDLGDSVLYQATAEELHRFYYRSQPN